MGSANERLNRTDGLLAPYAYKSGTVFRWGLGVSMLLGGGFKILEPTVYQAYFAPLFASLWPTALISLNTVFLLAGIFELLFGVLLLANWHTPTVAGLTVPWLAATNTNFIVAIAQGEPTVDLLSLYIALMMLALGVALNASREKSRNGNWT